MQTLRVGSMVAVGLILLLTSGIGTAVGIDWNEVATPTPAPAIAFGGAARGCLAGASALPDSGAGYQVMRLSRNRYYGHPILIDFIRQLAAAVHDRYGQGLLIGDLAQPRGGPMNSGHRSHQNGLDVDIWFLPAPADALSEAERESLSATSVVDTAGMAVDRTAWSTSDAGILRMAAEFPQVDRIFVNAAIKQELCRVSEGDRTWLARIRPWWAHDDHFHVRLRCPEGDGGCIDQQPPVPDGDGCDASLAWWFSPEATEELRIARAGPPPRLTLDDLPEACRGVLSGF